jgi:hypothetical protein
LRGEEGQAGYKENRRNAGEQLVEKILACQHPRLAYFTPGHLKVAAASPHVAATANFTTSPELAHLKMAATQPLNRW